MQLLGQGSEMLPPIATNMEYSLQPQLTLGTISGQMERKFKKNMQRGFCAKFPKLDDSREFLRSCNSFEIFGWFSEDYFHSF